MRCSPLLRRSSLLPAVLLCIVSAVLAAAPRTDPAGAELDRMFDAAKEAIDLKNYETAVRLLTEAKRKFPAATRVTIALADLYYEKELYALALEQYKSAEAAGAIDLDTLSQISRCFGKLNRESDSLQYLERIMATYPDSSDGYDDAGWMYFKTHQLEKGEQVLRKGIERFGLEMGMAMTLGTVYSGMNRYAPSKEYYGKSIEKAAAADDRTLAAIAWYNLSLLERNFYNYNSALSDTEESLAMEDRPSGHLARGELLQSRMEYRAALAEYEAAAATDTTPLSRVNLGVLHQAVGHLELARRYVEEARGAKDLAWMMYYGTDVTRHFKDVHELLADVHGGLARVAAARPTRGPFRRVAALVDSLRHRLLSWHYRQRFRIACLQVGSSYLAQGSVEEACLEFFKANTRYPEVAASYLERARVLETARAPHAEAFYLMEEGGLKRSPPLLVQSIQLFDPFWEKEAIADCLLKMVPLLRHPADLPARRESLQRLFEINPGALPQAGLGLPLELRFEGGRWGRREKRLIGRYLIRAHSEIGAGMRHALTFRRQADGGVRFSVADARTGRIVAEGGTTADGGRTADRGTTRGDGAGGAAGLVQVVLDELYAVR